MAIGPIVGRIVAGTLGARTAAIASTRGTIAAATEALELLGREETVVVDVSSTAIAQIGFNEEDETIIVVFHRGGTYTYPGDRRLFDDFRNASSKGQFFNANIRPLG